MNDFLWLNSTHYRKTFLMEIIDFCTTNANFSFSPVDMIPHRSAINITYNTLLLIYVHWSLNLDQYNTQSTYTDTVKLYIYSLQHGSSRFYKKLNTSNSPKYMYHSLSTFKITTSQVLDGNSKLFLEKQKNPSLFNFIIHSSQTLY